MNHTTNHNINHNINHTMTKSKWREKLHRHHGLIMLLCCAIPVIIALGGSYYFGWRRSYLAWLFLLLCPLMHYWMMKEMHGKESHVVDKSSRKEQQPREEKPSCH